MQSRQALIDVAIYAVPTTLSKGITILLLPIWTRLLPPSEFGLWELLLATNAFLILMLPLEVGQGVARFLPQLRDSREGAELASTAFTFTLMTLGGYALFCLAFPDLIESVIFQSSDTEGWGELAGFSALAAGLLYAVQNHFRSSLKPIHYAIVSFVWSAFFAVSSVFFLIETSLGVRSLPIAQIASAGMALLVGLPLTRAGVLLRPVFHIQHLREILRFSLPLLVSSLSVYMINYVDRWMIQWMMGSSELGIYGVAARIGAIMGLVVLPLQMALTPRIYQHADEPGLGRWLGWALLAYVMLFLFIIMMWAGLGERAFGSLLPEVYEPAFAPSVLLVSSVGLAASYLFLPGLWVARKTKKILIINLLVAMVNLIMNYWLIPFLGVMGAAYSSLAAAMIQVVLFGCLGQKYLRVTLREA